MNHDVEETPVAASRSNQERSPSTSLQDESEDCGRNFKESLPCELGHEGASSTSRGEFLSVAELPSVAVLPSLLDSSLLDGLPVEESGEHTIPTGFFTAHSREDSSSVSPCQAAGGSQTVKIHVEAIKIEVDSEQAPVVASISNQERSPSTSLQDESEDCGSNFKESLPCELGHTGVSSTSQGEFLANLPCLLDSSLLDGLPVEESGEHTIPTGCFTVNSREDSSSVSPFQAAGGSQAVQIPVEGICDFQMSIQSPSKTTTTTLFILRQEQPNRAVVLYSVLCVPSQMVEQVCEWMREREGGRVQLCAFSDERAWSCGTDICLNLSIHNQMTVSFELTNDCHGKFIARYPDQLNEQVISLHSIYSEAHNRIGPPGARANLFLERLGSSHEPVHRAHIRVTIKNGEGQHKLVFCTWVFGPAYPD